MAVWPQPKVKKVWIDFCNRSSFFQHHNWLLRALNLKRSKRINLCIIPRIYDGENSSLFYIKMQTFNLNALNPNFVKRVQIQLWEYSNIFFLHISHRVLSCLLFSSMMQTFSMFSSIQVPKRAVTHLRISELCVFCCLPLVTVSGWKFEG